MPLADTPQGALFYARSGPPRHTSGCSEGQYPQPPPMLLIHGAGGSHLLWPAALRRMAGLSVLALDLPGHGRSAGTACGTIAEYAQAVAAFIRAMAIAPVVIVGHSMGGAIGLELALECADCVAGLVLIAAGAHMPITPTLLNRLKQDFEGALELIARTAWAPDANPALIRLGSTTLRATGPAVLHADFSACQRFDPADRLREISQPCLIVAGQLDQIVPPSQASLLAGQIAGSRHAVIEGAGHMLTLERPQAVAQAIRTFLQSECEIDPGEQA